MMIQPSVISILDLMIAFADRVRENTYARSHAIVSMMTSDVPIQRLPHGMSQTAVRAIAREKRARDFVSILDFSFWKNAIYTQAMIQER